MSDRELEELKQRRLRELQKRMAFKEQEKENKRERVDAYKVLDRVFRDRAWEVFNAARVQFPSEMVEVEHLLVNLTLAGKISEMGGDKLYGFLRKIGLPVRLNTTISFLSHGKTKSLSEKFKEKTE
jgi:DNA-binding TFAR19-related protein (PDSD5 family)